MHDLEAPAAFSDDVHASVGIFLGDRENFRGATDLGKFLVLAPNHPEMLLAVKALGNHLPVARLENVQRQGSAREQHQIQREQREQAHENSRTIAARDFSIVPCS